MLWLRLCIGAIAQDQANQPTAPEDTTRAEHFERHVRPLLLENCTGCHSRSVGKVKGGLSMDSRDELLAGGDSGPAIDLANPDGSLLLDAVRRQSLEMPPEKPLSPRNVVILEQWIRSGAFWPQQALPNDKSDNWIATRAANHWAWRPLQSGSPPHTGGQTWPLNPIDAFIWRGLRELELDPVGPASDSQILRRLAVDLTGLPPSLELARTYQQALSSGDRQLAYEQLIDQLLASPQFGVQWGRHWLDLMRYAETLGHEFDYPLHHAWQYRDCVVDGFNDDIPYRQMIVEHLAGDRLSSPRLHRLSGINQSLAATGWWWLGDSVHAPVDIKSDWATRIENQVDVLSKAFLGMTVACARCHDHKFDAISTADYYGLVGIARSTRRQYAITDPTQQISLQRRRMRELMLPADAAAHSAWQAVTPANISQWLTTAIAHWKSLSSDELNQSLPIQSPLYPLRLLVQSSAGDGDPGQDFAARALELSQQLRQLHQQYTQWEANSYLLADFRDGLPSGWTLEAVEPNDWRSERPRVDWFVGHLPMPVRPDVLSSQLWGRRQYLTLRSPDFQVTTPCVCIKMRGKSTQSVTLVDNYFMGEFHGLLFSDLRKPIDQSIDGGWVIHAGDLKKYLGHSAYLSLENDAGAWFEIQQVRCAPQAPPPEPHPWALQILTQQVANPDAFSNLIVEQLQAALAEVISNPATGNPGSLAAVRAMFSTLPERLLDPTEAEQLSTFAKKLQELDSQTPQPTRLTVASEGTPQSVPIELRGDPHRTGQVVPRGCFTSLVSWTEPAHDSSGRWELAQSLTDPKHPLVSRVIVNRVWHHLLGRGLIASPDNLGVLGNRPTHPELLDWLADQFVQHDWSIKWLIRQIVTSQTYQLGSTPAQRHQLLDPDAALWSHRSVRRLTAENLRDAALFTADCLDLSLGGASVPVYLTEQMTGRGRPARSGPLDGDHRRSLYLEVRRNFLNPFLAAFDQPMPSTTVGRRNISNVPAQALSLLNDPLIVHLSQRWADATQPITDPQQRARRMLETAFTCLADTDQISQAVQFVERSGEHGWQELAHVLLNSKAFCFVP
ncbi:MAG: PSD1 domain-containing protein [Pirellulaceae bacterium]|nr:PSD1 domain-containing protein [Pirellulaceae bacterium]